MRLCTVQAAQAARRVEEKPVLMAINAERARAGQAEVTRLTVDVLKQHLRGRVIRGAEWRAGNKKRAELVADCR